MTFAPRALTTSRDAAMLDGPDRPARERPGARRLIRSTSDLAAHLDDAARFTRWRDGFQDWFGLADLAPPAQGGFQGEWTLVRFEEFILGRFRGTAHEIARTPEQAAMIPQARILLTFNLAPEPLLVSQAGRDTIVGVGEAALWSGGKAFRCADAGAWMSLGIPRILLEGLVHDVDELIASTHDASRPAMRHLQRTLAMLLEPDGLADDPAVLEHVEATLVDLVTLALDAAGDGPAGARGPRGARLAEILNEIRKGFTDPEFSLERTAARINVSPNYIQKLLHPTGLSFSERVLELRLQKARAMLNSRRADHLKVSNIAMACGFSDISYFNRCFRRRFGSSPTRYRSGE